MVFAYFSLKNITDLAPKGLPICAQFLRKPVITYLLLHLQSASMLQQVDPGMQ